MMGDLYLFSICIQESQACANLQPVKEGSPWLQLRISPENPLTALNLNIKINSKLSADA